MTDRLVDLLELRAQIISAIAPAAMRIAVNVAASIAVVFSAARQSSELPANESIASSVRTKTRAGDTARF